MKEIVELYVEVPSVDKVIVDKSLVMHMMSFNMALNEIIDQLLESLVDVLSDKRQEEILEEAKMRQ